VSIIATQSKIILEGPLFLTTEIALAFKELSQTKIKDYIIKLSVEDVIETLLKYT
jgi:hypothetical protein